MKRFWLFLVIVLMAARLLAESNDTPETLKLAKVQVQAKLDQFRKTNTVELLLDARKIASSINPRGDRTALSKLDEECLLLQLKVLLAIADACDPHYDRKASTNAVYRNVMPPLTKGGGPFASGMDPKGIKDPEARKAYEAAITENRRRAEKLNREMSFSREVDYAAINIWVFVNRGFPEKSPAKPAAYAVIEKTVTDKALLARLKSDTMPGLMW